MVQPRRPGDSRIKITAASVADTALAMIRETGVSSLTMRAVAARLGVSAPALYHHVAGREELLDLVARRVPADSGDTETSLDSVTTIEEYVELARPGALAMRDYYLGHPGLARVMLDRIDRRGTDGVDDRDERTNADVEALTRAGLDPTQASATFDTLARWTLAAIAAEHDAPTSSQHADESFAQGLDLLLTGLTASVNQALISEGPEIRRRPR